MGTHGGRRPGAGRKKGEVREIREQVNAIMDRIALPAMPDLINSLVHLARGTREVEVWKPHGSVPMDSVVRDEHGQPIVRVGLSGDEVLVATVDVPAEAGPNFQAAKYLLDRYLGLPRQALEIKQTGKEPDVGPSAKDEARRELSAWSTLAATDDAPSNT